MTATTYDFSKMELFRPGFRPTRVNGIALSIQSQGGITFSMDAFEAIGSPDRVVWMTDTKTRMLAVRAAGTGDENFSYKVKNRTAHAAAVLKSMGIVDIKAVAGRRAATVERGAKGPMLVFTLPSDS